jgi:hypothetical protein
MDPKNSLMEGSSCNVEGATKVLLASSMHASGRSFVYIELDLPFADLGCIAQNLGHGNGEKETGR